MVSLLARLFIKNREDVSAPEVRQSYGILCGAVGIGLNILLFLGKFLAGLISRSIAITADAFNNLSDAGSSLITLVGFKMSGQEADSDHPFGHGRIEYITGLLVSIAILIMAVELIRSSAEKILHPEEVVFNSLVVGILIISILVKIYMYLYNRKISRTIGSAAMMATAKDSLSDTMATAVVLISTLTAHFTGIQIDGWCGVLVGLFIFYAGFSAAKDTISPLLGQPPEKEFVKQIEEIVLSHEGILGIHDLVVHDYGPGRRMVSLHAEVSASGNMLALHDTIDNIERDLQRELKCSAVIHMDPIMNDDEETLELKEKVTAAVKELDPCVGIHDFRIVKGHTHTNIIFDVLVPYHFKYSDSEIRTLIGQKITEINSSYYAVIDVDKDFNDMGQERK